MTAVDDFQAATEDLAAGTQKQVLAVYASWKAGEVSQADAELLITGIINRANASGISLADVYIAAQVQEATGLPTPVVGVLPVDASDQLAAAVHTIFSEPPKTKFTQAEVRDLIVSARLNPKYYDVKTITGRVNEALRSDHLPDPDEPDYVPAHGAYNFEDFIETVAEEPRMLSELGLFPPPPRGTEAYAQWEKEVDEARQEINSDDYDHFPPIWESEPEHADMRLERLARAEPLDSAQRATIDVMQGHDSVEGWTRQMDADPCQLCRWWWREGRIWPKQHPFQRHKGCNCQPRVIISEHIQSTVYTRRLERERAAEQRAAS